MTHDQWVGWVLWVLIFYPIWSPRCRRWRKARRLTTLPDATRSTGTHTGTTAGRQTGPKWEQDEPYAECFETDEGDDLDG